MVLPELSGLYPCFRGSLNNGTSPCRSFHQYKDQEMEFPQDTGSAADTNHNMGFNNSVLFNFHTSRNKTDKLLFDFRD